MGSIRSWLIDMDGVLVREEHPIPGAEQFLRRLREGGASFLVLTNNSMYTPRDLAARLRLRLAEVSTRPGYARERRGSRRPKYADLFS